MYDETVAVKVTGEQLLECLENGVCKYPAMEGRFPCVSGIKSVFFRFFVHSFILALSSGSSYFFLTFLILASALLPS